MTYMMNKHTTTFQFRPNGIKSLLLMLLLVMGVGESVGQIEEGFYYIIWNNHANTCYLAPGTRATQDFYNSDAATPYLRPTLTLSDDVIWEIRNAGGNYYYLIHYIDGKYVVLNNTAATGEPSEAVHLESNPADITSNTVKFYFLETSSSGVYNIMGLYNADAGFNPWGGYNGFTQPNSNGRIGLYRTDDGGSKWKFSKIGNTVVEAPVITPDYTNNKISLSCSTEGSFIYYVTGDIHKSLSPSSTKFESDLDMISNTIYYVTAYAKTEDGSFSLITSQKIATRTSVADPVINNEGNKISITCTTENVDIYYTTDGTDPTVESTHYDGTFSLDAGRYTIKAKVILPKCSSSVVSQTIDLRTSLPKPVIMLNDEKTEATITYTGGAEGDVIKYTLDGTDPTFSSSTYTTPLTINSATVDKIKAIAYNAEGNISSRIATKYVRGYQYVAIHQNGTGFLKVTNSNVDIYNENTFRYADAFDNNGNSIWVLTEEGYLKNQYYYLNVTNNNTLYLSVEPVTNWEFDEVDANGKMSIKYNDMYLCYSSGIKLLASPTSSYRACPITITEVSWSGPTTTDVTVVSPQLVTYLRHYYTQKFTYTFVDDGGTPKTESDKDRRIYATLTHADADNTEWGIVDGVIYNKKTKDNAVVTETYSISSSDPIALGEHPEEDKSIKLTVKQKPFAPNSSKNYILYSIKADDNYRYPYDDGIAGNGLLKANGKGGTGDASVLTDPANDQISWKISVDAKGFYSFKNVNTGNYIYFDDTPCTESYFGVLRVGASNIPSGDEGNKYKFKLYNFSNSDYNSCYQIIPYCRLDVVFKNDGMAGKLNACINNSDYKTHNVISLSVYDNSHWGIYTYEATYRLRNSDDMSINGPVSVDAIGNYTFTSSEAWYGKFISGSKDAGNLVISGTYTTAVDYIWTVTGLDPYINIEDANHTGDSWTKTINGNRNLVINVANLPVGTTSGVIQVQWKAGTGDNTKWSGKKTFSFTIMGNGSVEIAEINALSEITNPNGAYKLKADANVAYSDSNKPSVPTFSGILDGNDKTITGLNAPLFATLNNGTVRNLNIADVNISTSGSVGAIAGTAKGGSRIYNVGILGGSVGSTDGNCGGLVGTLDGSARVINCFSYANITSGTNVGGIVGYNSYESKSNDIRTMVMNCMFYGNATGTSVSPIYGGKMIRSNYVGAMDAGINNYNYYRAKSTLEGTIVYNCALAAEDRHLQRFEFYRQILNSNRELAAWYVLGMHPDNAREIMLKWVLETADRDPVNTNPKEYPVLKKQDKIEIQATDAEKSEGKLKMGTYPSIINYDTAHAPTTAERNQGAVLGELSVSIQFGSGNPGDDKPAGASLKTTGLTLKITDKDYSHNNFNYRKVQLPYYNEVGKGNYTGNRVVTGWKIVTIAAGSKAYSTGANITKDASGNVTATPYNFADRDCTDKDKYSVSGRVFSQGAYFDVPNGVESITIEPYWAVATYCSDANYDKTYNSKYGNATDFALPGKRYNNDNNYTINGSSQKVYTSLGTAIDKLSRQSGKTVYDYAVVLVGNYHDYKAGSQIKNDDLPFTLMSADLDFDNEPDYCYIYQHENRQPISPVRFDFLCWPGIGMAQKANGSKRMPGIGIFKPRGWFEVTNTVLARLTEVEYDQGDGVTKVPSPFILLGGEVDQIVSTQKNTANKTAYIHLGSNVWFKDFNAGCHADNKSKTTHCPVSITGGDFEKLHLSGMYRNDVVPDANDHAECYISGGRIVEAAGSGMEKIDGNVYWQIDHADITNFFGGGINAKQEITGDIDIDIKNSHVSMFCGGPKYGDMHEGKKVTVHASVCEFETYFGAGYGGTSYNRIRGNGSGGSSDGQGTNALNYDFNSWVTTYYNRKYNKDKDGIATSYESEFFAYAGFNADTNVGRFYVNYASLSLATTHSVTSVLDDCIITGKFFGGGNLGKVDGDISSTLNNCTVNGDVYGAGFSATAPTVDVMPVAEFKTEPFYNESSGAYTQGVYPTAVPYTWHYTTTPVAAGSEFDETNKYILTNVNFPEEGGTVTGDVTLNIRGTTTVSGDVYGGGALASSNTGTNKKTTINLLGGTITGNVYGGGMGQLAAAAVGTAGQEGYVPAKKDVEAKVGSTQVNLNGMDATEYQAAYSAWGLVSEGDGKPYTVANTGVKGCVVKGSIFGCNNINGSPKGDATVHVYKTQNANATQIGNAGNVTNAKEKGRYDLTAVYGGGNLAPFIPTVADASTHVIVDGCDLTSIETVYGGGNAASTPATNVTVNGTYEINELFGGGNGKDPIPYGSTTRENPGANVGYRNYSTYDENTGKWLDNGDADTKEERLTSGYVYGSGAANVTIYGGTIHQVFGGSNTKGNVRISAVTLLEDQDVCEFCVDEAYGGGKSAPMDAEAQLHMACIPGLKEAYGGAEAANIDGNVTLNITNGNFDRVFGGNKISGTISGTITVNIEEIGCKPIIIGQLYGGGNLAAYTAPTGHHGPTVNVKSFTSIGEVYGGGYGTGAVVTGDTYVNINEVLGDKASDNQFMKEKVTTVEDPATQTTGDDKVSKNTGVTKTFKDGDGENANTISVEIPLHKSGKIGVINNVFGGGNAAEVNGNTNVNIGTVDKVYVVKSITAGTTFTTTDRYYTRNDDGTYTQATGTATSGTTYYEEKDIVGVDIRGNVYGGGNNAEVTGNTNVTIGKRAAQ